MPRTLIAGCGYLGSALATLLTEAGHEVFGLRRGAEPSSGVQPLRADLTSAAGLDALPARLDSVVFAAAASDYGEAAYRAIYVDGLRNLVDALQRAGAPPRRLLFTSSTAVYAHNDGSRVDELSTTAATHFSGRVMLEAEGLLADCGMEAAALRLGGIYGPGRARLIHDIRSGRLKIVSGAPQYTNRIHRDDAARALAHLLTLAEIEATYVGVDRDPAPRDEVLDWIAGQLGVEPPERVPAGDATSPMRGNKRCSSHRLVASGFEFRYPSYREGYGELLETAGES